MTPPCIKKLGIWPLVAKQLVVRILHYFAIGSKMLRRTNRRFCRKTVSQVCQIC